MMKRLFTAAVTASALCAASAAWAENAPASAPQTPVFDAQGVALLRNIDARLAELNLKLSAPQVQGCSDGERVYTQGLTVKMKNGFSYRCDFVNERFMWNYVSQ